MIDGNSIMNRAFYGIRMLSNKKGAFTNALTGFMNIYMKLLKEEQPDRVGVAFDLKAPTFRHKMYDGYKATRHGMPEELAQQMPIIKELLKALGVTVVEKEGYEADDIIGTLSRAAAENGGECVIMTGDRDSFQLVGERITVRLAGNKEDVHYTPAKIREVYGVEPREMLEVKALMGDQSDNIPGVPGVGEKTALGLIQKYHTVEYIYENIDSIEVTNSVRNKLINGKDSAELSRRLGEIELHAPVSENMEDYRIAEGDRALAAGILTEMEMFGVMKKLELDGTAPKAPVNMPQSAPAAKVESSPKVTPDTAEYDGEALTVMTAGDDIVIFRGENAAEGDLKELLESGEPKHTDNAKALYSRCIKEGISLNNVTFDATLAAYLLNVNANDYSIERLCAEYKVAEEAPAAALNRLNEILFGEICAQGMLKVLREIELPLAEVLSSMETEGIGLDVKALHDFGEGLLPQIDQLEKNIHLMAGHEFNIGSPKQLGTVLFEELGLPAGKKRKTGYATDAETLEGLADKHPICSAILDYRKLTKLYNTYVKGLESCVSPDGRMHTTFKQTETRTGRISSAEPNIQNIPVRTELGRSFRGFFRAAEGKLLVDADYSQIELRVLASLAEDKVMIDTFKEERDIHTETASKVFGMPPEWVDGDMRRRAKAVNFGIVYGIGAFSLAKDIGASLSEAKKYIEDYLDHFSGVRNYMDSVTKSAEEDGYAVTLFGRRRFIPEILAANKTVKALGKRIAMNTPIQGTAADIIKLAMVRVYRRLKAELPEARLILQVHDELIVEVPEALADRACAALKEEMESAVSLAVPLIAEAKAGKTWLDAH